MFKGEHWLSLIVFGLQDAIKKFTGKWVKCNFVLTASFLSANYSKET